MEQKLSELDEETLRTKIKDIFKEPLFKRIKKEQEFRSYVAQLENRLGDQEHWAMVRKNFYNPNYQHIPCYELTVL